MRRKGCMWLQDEYKQVEYANGKNDWKGTNLVAAGCGYFTFDTEEEIIEEGIVSCYNCRFRRWTRNSFTCMIKNKDCNKCEQDV